jgi:hypothetical protein
MREGFESVGDICERIRRETPRRRARGRARSLSPAAIRARARRARARNGIEHDLRVRVPTRRLQAAMRAARQAANSDIGPLDTRQEIERELQSIIEEFIDRWLGRRRFIDRR